MTHIPVLHACHQQYLLCDVFTMPKNLYLMRAHVEKVCKPYVKIQFHGTNSGVFNDTNINFTELANLNLDPNPWSYLERVFLNDTKDIYNSVLKINPDYLKPGLKMLQGFKDQKRHGKSILGT